MTDASSIMGRIPAFLMAEKYCFYCPAIPIEYGHGAMELRHLRYFIAVAAEENVTRAATRLHISQPPLSRQLRDLEEELGFELFTRGPKSLKLTSAGKLFLVEASKILQTVDEALRVAQTLAGKQTAEIHVGYAPSLTIELLPMALRSFDTRCSGTQVRLYDLSTEEMLERLASESIDVALMIKPIASSLRGLEFRTLRKMAVCLAMHSAHPLAQTAEIGMAQICQERLVSYSKEDYPEYHQWLVKLFRKAGHVLKVGEEHDSSTSLIAAVESGRGVALVQEGFENLCGPRLKLRKLIPPPAPFVVGMAWRKGRMTKVLEHFLAAVNEVTSGKALRR
ncbi:MAG: LysR substrate-binding domain-containing protein [Verrucomicrobia bacterium]|nr:LysR substrate-binding domain-containing protein [Verrucomicrobiota bacterium]